MKKIMALIIGWSLLLFSAVPAQVFYDRPESVVFDDVNNRYIVSNYGTGSLVEIDEFGVESFFVTGLVHSL